MPLSTACKLIVMYVAFTIGALLADIPLLLAHEQPASAHRPSRSVRWWLPATA
jgi:hypothetical protein